jgi:hypothetical protein
MTTRGRFFCAANSWDDVSTQAGVERLKPSAQFAEPAGAGFTDPPSRTKIRPERARPAATFAIENPNPA